MNILIIGGRGNAPSANSVCVRNMAREFISQGHKVWNLASGDECVTRPGVIGGAELWQIPGGWYEIFTKRTEQHPTTFRLICFKIVSLIRHLALVLIFPMTDPVRSWKLLKKANDLVKDNDISLVVAIFNSYENIYSAMKLKRLYKDKMKVVSYHLDLRTSNGNTSAAVRKYVYRHVQSSIVKESEIVDKILIPYSGRIDIERMQGIKREKIKYVGFPVFIEKGGLESIILPFDKRVINISYIGSLSPENRNPFYVLSLLEKVSDKIEQKIMVHFWGGCAGLEDILAKSPVAIYHGTIENQFVRYILDSSDFLLNIGNTLTYNMMPSKVFGLFATGKPIINVINHPQDACLPFFKRYNHSIDLKEYCHSHEDFINLYDGIQNMLGQPLRDVNGLFDDFKPDTICREILQ